jgi:thioredoxin-dependent peroxiredoxin
MSKFGKVNVRLILSVAAAVALIVFALPSLYAQQAPAQGSDAQVMPAVGTPAPDFTLPNQEGTKVSLHDFKGKWVVLYFYPKDMTPGCTVEAHNFQTDLAQYDAKNAVILGVSADNVDSHKEFCAKDSLTFKILADPDHVVITKYGSLNTQATMANRNTFLIDPKGNIVKVYTKVNPTHHSADLLTDLTTLQATK